MLLAFATLPSSAATSGKMLKADSLCQKTLGTVAIGGRAKNICKTRIFNRYNAFALTAAIKRLAAIRVNCYTAGMKLIIADLKDDRQWAAVTGLSKNLSLNRCLSPADDGTRKVKHGQVILGLLFPSDQQPTKAIDP